MAMQELGRKDSVRYVTSYGIEIFILALAIVIVFTLFWLDRTETSFPWLGVIYIALLVYVFLFVVTRTSTWMDVSTSNLIMETSSNLRIGLWIVFWASWFRLKMWRIHMIVWPLIVLLWATRAMVNAPFYGQQVPAKAGPWIVDLNALLVVVVGLLLMWLALQGVRKDRVEGLLALPAVLVVVLGTIDQWFAVLHLPRSIHPFGIYIPFGQMSTMVILCMITVLLLRRFFRNRREREK